MVADEAGLLVERALDAEMAQAEAPGPVLPPVELARVRALPAAGLRLVAAAAARCWAPRTTSAR